MIELSGFLMLVSIWIILATCIAMIYTFFRKRITRLEPRVRLFLLGVMFTWFGTFFYAISVPIVSYLLTLIGGLITIQILLEWKYGKYIWLKVLILVLFLGLIGYPLVPI